SKSMTSTTVQIARNRSDDIFFPGMSLLALAVVVAAFGQSYFFAGMTTARLPSPLVHIHAAILTAWIVLQVLQPLQIAVARVDWHQRVGLAGTGVAAAVPVIGVLAGIGQIRRHEASLAHLTGDFAFVLAAA